jgi:hypothetical protein
MFWLTGSEQVHALALLQAAEDDLRDRVGHLGEQHQLLVAVDALLQVGLRQRAEAEALKQVDQQAGLHAIAGEERRLLDRLAPRDILAGQRLDHAGQLG